jgi:hypothetical protein
MTQQQLLHEFFSLPTEAQRQVAELITSLKNVNASVSDAVQPIDFSANPFVGMWKDRQDLADSSAWVRHVRQAEW